MHNLYSGALRIPEPITTTDKGTIDIPSQEQSNNPVLVSSSLLEVWLNLYLFFCAFSQQPAFTCSYALATDLIYKSYYTAFPASIISPHLAIISSLFICWVSGGSRRRPVKDPSLWLVSEDCNSRVPIRGHWEY